MITFYFIPIFYVYKEYKENKNSVSSIICDQKCKNIILFFMFFMGVATFLYELERNDTLSTIIVSLMILCIFGLISINEKYKLHYIFAFIVFTSIFIFMTRHCYLTDCNYILLLSIMIQIILLITIIFNMADNNNIYHSEVFYILNFAFFYLYLHSIN